MSEGATMVGSPVDLPHAKYVEIKITNDMSPAPVPANRRAQKINPPGLSQAADRRVADVVAAGDIHQRATPPRAPGKARTHQPVRREDSRCTLAQFRR